MTDTQLALLVGVIYITPHINKNVSLCLGCVFLIVAALKGILT